MSSPTPFLTPCNICLVGAQQSGKTQLVVTLLQDINYYFSPTPKKILYCYCEWQPIFDQIQDSVKNLEFHQGLPDDNFLNKWSRDKEGYLIILDDLMGQVCTSPDMVQLFTVKCHHRQISTLMLNQSLFPVGKYARTLSLNLNYLILFKNLRDAMQIKRFGSQIFPNKLNFFMEAYEKATAEPFGFLCIDMHPKGNRKYQLRSKILKGEQPVIVYVPSV